MPKIVCNSELSAVERVLRLCGCEPPYNNLIKIRVARESWLPPYRDLVCVGKIEFASDSEKDMKAGVRRPETILAYRDVQLCYRVAAELEKQTGCPPITVVCMSPDYMRLAGPWYY